MKYYAITLETLRYLGNKIRQLSGSDEELTTETALAELQAQKNNVEDVKTTLRDLGVEVSEGATIADLINLITQIESNIDTSDATADASEILLGETAYVNGEKITGSFTIEPELTTQDDLIAQIQTALEGKVAGGTVELALQEKTISPTTTVQEVVPDAGYTGLSKVTVKAMMKTNQAAPTINVDSSGLITASVMQTAGYVDVGTKSVTKQLTTQTEMTVTPTKESRVIVASDIYTTGDITVEAIPDEYITTSDATASADRIMYGDTAYINGEKITGTFTIDEELSAQDDLISQIQTALSYKIAGNVN